MKLRSLRLLAIARSIEKHKTGNVLADIGTDHAYLPCFLYDEKVVDLAYACDVAEGPLDSSKETIAENNMEGHIIPLLGSGLDPVCDKDIDMVSICGMGGLLIADILDAHKEMLENHRFFLQANTAIAELREYLNKNGMKIIDEEMVEDAKHIYEFMVVEKGEQTLSEDDLLFGPVNRVKKDPLFIKKWNFELNVYKKILASLPDGHKKKEATMAMIEKIEKVIAC